ncbi:DUF2182 domain-containing protein, partial [Mesorhizobium sp. M7A.F.Ca.MR.228.00.0.0]
MGDTALEAVLRRDRAVVMAALVVIAVLAWAYVLWLAATMVMPGSPLPDSGGGDMAGMDMGAAMAPGFRPWALGDFAFTFTMWAVMMVGMM